MRKRRNRGKGKTRNETRKEVGREAKRDGGGTVALDASLLPATKWRYGRGGGRAFAAVKIADGWHSFWHGYTSLSPCVSETFAKIPRKPRAKRATNYGLAPVSSTT